MFNPDYGCPSSSPFTCFDHQLVGVAAFADYNHIIGRVGLEGEGRWLNWHSNNLNQSNYLAGPRVLVFSGRRMSANVKFLAGGAFIHYPWPHSHTDFWSAYVPGGTVGYRVSPRFLVRADYEYQMWPGYVGVKGQHGLTPNGFTVGVSYRLFR
jgi:hypothetical protein